MSFFQGFLIVLAVLLMNSAVAFIQTDVAAAPQIAGCSNNGNFTTCSNTSTTSFLSSLFSVTVTGFGDGAPLIVNVLWVLLMGALLIAGIVMIVLSFIPFVSG